MSTIIYGSYVRLFLSVKKHLQLFKILLYSNHQHVLATHLAIFKVARTRAQPQLLCVRINPQLEIHIILIKFTVKRVFYG